MKYFHDLIFIDNGLIHVSDNRFFSINISIYDKSKTEKPY
jgi:hypothetical protein